MVNPPYILTSALCTQFKKKSQATPSFSIQILLFDFILILYSTLRLPYFKCDFGGAILLEKGQIILELTY